jgi:putative spermidine/putrescine transport system permease protein
MAIRIGADERREPIRASLAGMQFTKLAPWVLVAPALVLVAVFLLYPLLGVVLRSFSPTGALSYTHPVFSGTNYKAVASDPAARIILRNTFVIAAIAAAIAVAIAYPVAAFLARLPPNIARWALLLALFPFWTSILVRLYAFQLILGKLGLLFTQTATVIGMVSYLLPYLIVIFYGGMVGIDTNLIRAARTLGASGPRAFRHVFFPLSRPALYSGTLLVFVIGLGFFLTPALLGSPSGITVAMYIQQQVNIASWGEAAAMGVGLLVAALVVYYFFDRLFGVERLAPGSAAAGKGTASATGARTPVLTLSLGAWSAAVFAFLILPLIYVVLISFSSQSYLTFPPKSFSTQWYKALFSDPQWGQAAWLSLKVALLTTLFATGAGLLAAIGLVRGNLPGQRLLRAIFMLPLVVPVILIAAAVYDLESRIRLSGTVLGYAVGHTMLALPFTILICMGSLQQVGSTMEEAARTLGAGRIRAFASVTLPLILPSVAAAAVIAFITSWDEVVIALFLKGYDQTLPVAIFSFVSQDLTPTVAALASIILAGVLVAGSLLLVGTALHKRWRASRILQPATVTEMAG